MSLTIVDFVKQQESLFIKAATDERMVWAKESQFAVQLFQNNDYRDWETDRKSTRLNSSHSAKSRMPSSA